MAFELSQKLPNLPDEILRLIAPSSVDLDSINTKKFTHVIKVKQVSIYSRIVFFFNQVLTSFKSLLLPKIFTVLWVIY